MNFTFDANAFFSLILGSAVTWFVTWLYYKRAAAELAQESRELRRLTTLILRALEEAGLVRFTRDQSGAIAGLVLQLRATGVAGSSGSAQLTVKRPGDPAA
jgi:type II secretory pathway component PulJ